jgi:hypothetical protein
MKHALGGRSRLSAILGNKKSAYNVETVADIWLLSTKYERKPWSLYRLVTSLPASNAPQQSKSTFRHNQQSKIGCNFHMVHVRRVKCI